MEPDYSIYPRPYTEQELVQIRRDDQQEQIKFLQKFQVVHVTKGIKIKIEAKSLDFVKVLRYDDVLNDCRQQVYNFLDDMQVAVVGEAPSPDGMIFICDFWSFDRIKGDRNAY